MARPLAQSLFGPLQASSGMRTIDRLLPETVAGFRPEVDGIAEATTGVELQGPHVAQLLARFRGFNPKDIEG